MMATTPVVDFFGTLPEGWDVDPLTDQGIAGGLAWSYGELPSVLMLLIIMVRWQREETITSRATDRKHNVEGTPELDAYNAYLEQLRLPRAASATFRTPGQATIETPEICSGAPVLLTERLLLFGRRMSSHRSIQGAVQDTVRD